MNNTRYTKADDCYLVENIGTKPYKEISQALGRSEMSIQQRAIRLGLVERKKKIKPDDIIRHLESGDKTASDIAHRIGVKSASVHKHLVALLESGTIDNVGNSKKAVYSLRKKRTDWLSALFMPMKHVGYLVTKNNSTDGSSAV